MVTGFVDVGEKRPRKTAQLPAADRPWFCVRAVPEIARPFPKVPQQIFSLFLAVDPARKPTHC
jgi:hypothetical protein